jgi:hypothetical protein
VVVICVYFFVGLQIFWCGFFVKTRPIIHVKNGVEILKKRFKNHSQFGTRNAPMAHFHRSGIIFGSILEGFLPNYE